LLRLFSATNRNDDFVRADEGAFFPGLDLELSFQPDPAAHGTFAPLASSAALLLSAARLTLSETDGDSRAPAVGPGIAATATGTDAHSRQAARFAARRACRIIDRNAGALACGSAAALPGGGFRGIVGFAASLASRRASRSLAGRRS